MKTYETVIGLEIHAELKTSTKMFCACKNDPFHAEEPNIYICPVCLGLPGALPVMNRQAVEWTVLVGLALGCEIGWRADNPPSLRQGEAMVGVVDQRSTKWDRKNYFYPDLPKGYQISQYDLPICHAGSLTLTANSESQIANRKDGGPTRYSPIATRQIDITRIHLEEDTGKLVHPPSPRLGGASEGQVQQAAYSLIDYNRSGVPLMELVTEPVIRTGEEAAAFAQIYQLVLRTLGVSDADMEKGQMRVEANISVCRRQKTEDRRQKFGTKVEVKNLNSLKSVRQAIAYETERQIELIESGGKVTQETRGWDETKQETFSQRVKETAADYRYYPDPDLPPVTIQKTEDRRQKTENKGIDLEALRAQLSELPWDRIERYMEDLRISEDTAKQLIYDVKKSRYFDACWVNINDDWRTDSVRRGSVARHLVFWILRDLSPDEVVPKDLAELAQMVASDEINTKLAKDLLVTMRATGRSPRAIIEEEGLAVVRDDSAILAFVTEIIASNSQAVTDWKTGKAQALGYLVGQVMAKSRGQADPKLVRETLQQILSKEGKDGTNQA
jgi:aspartyl-tRNA(Asn)/glutamyl-tRNA(Gln) amidotransferase subunit B